MSDAALYHVIRWSVIFFRPLMVKGVLCALTGRAAFLFRGNVANFTLTVS